MFFCFLSGQKMPFEMITIKKIVYSVYFSLFSVLINRGNKLWRQFLMANLAQFDQNHKIFFLKSTELYVEFKYSLTCIFIILNLRLPKISFSHFVEDNGFKLFNPLTPQFVILFTVNHTILIMLVQRI